MIAAVRQILSSGGLCAAAFPGYESRPGQLAMAERIAAAIEGDERLLVEAGTGTGKTLAYLIPALLSGRKVVVSTGTKTLQDQIATIDLPRLRAILDPTGALGRPLTWALMKGLQNYVCLRRLGERDRQRSLLPSPELDRVLAWVSETATGDRADLAELPDDSSLWRDVQATPETRIGARCTYFEKCFVTQMRRRAADAQLVIVNHHLYFADLALRTQWPEAQVLPPHEVVIFDEAHQIEDVATEFFGLHVSTQRLFALARDLARAAALDAARAQSATGRLNGAAGALADALRDRLPAPRPGLDEVRVPVPENLWTGPALARYHELDGVLEEIATWLDGESDAVRESDHPAELAALGRRANAVRGDLGQLAGGRATGRGRSDVRWLAATARNVSLHASPIHVGPTLARAFDACPGPLIFTSATLTVAGAFDFIRERIGLGDSAAEVTFASPFRYARQSLLYVAADLPEPKNEAFAAAAAARMAELATLTGGRALLLFTSFKNLRVAEAYLRAKTKLPLLVQGERPRHLLLATLREKIGSVLLATQSFWEGVDVPGEALSLVVMDKIPFAVPDDPLTAARIDHIRENDGEPFSELQLPRAALALKQGFGRLIRSHGDFGIVAVLDGRLHHRAYGARLIASLPPDCPRTESLEDVAAFWARGPVVAAARARAELAARQALEPSPAEQP